MARFMPFVRTFAPVVAGIGRMNYKRFVSFNVVGGIAWTLSMTLLGFTLGKVYPPITKQIDKVIIVIIAVSLIPGRDRVAQQPEEGEEGEEGKGPGGRGVMAAKPSKTAPSAKTAKPAKPAPKRRSPPSRRRKAAKAKVAFPKKNHSPTEAEFLARLPLPVGKKFEGVRAFLKKQGGVVEDLYFYGPKTGWAFRYRRGPHSLATVTLHSDRLVGIVALDAAALGEVDFTALSEVGEQARRFASGSPSLAWLDLPLDGHGAADFKVLLKAKLKTLPSSQPAASLPPPPPPPPKKKSNRGD